MPLAPFEIHIESSQCAAGHLSVYRVSLTRYNALPDRPEPGQHPTESFPISTASTQLEVSPKRPSYSRVHNTIARPPRDRARRVVCPFEAKGLVLSAAPCPLLSWRDRSHSICSLPFILPLPVGIPSSPRFAFTLHRLVPPIPDPIQKVPLG